MCRTMSWLLGTLISSSSVSQWANKMSYDKITGGLTLRGEGEYEHSESKAETE